MLLLADLRQENKTNSFPIQEDKEAEVRLFLYGLLQYNMFALFTNSYLTPQLGVF